MTVLWIVDGRSPPEGLAMVPPESATDRVFFIETTTIFPELAAQVRRASGMPASLARIVSHGTAGRLLLSNMPVNRHSVGVFAFLRDVIAPSTPGAAVELHGCGIASDWLPPPSIVPGICNAQVADYGTMQGRTSMWGDVHDGFGDAMLLSQLAHGAGVNFLDRFADACGHAVRGAIDHQTRSDRTWAYGGATIVSYPGLPRQRRLFDPENRLGLGMTHSF